MFNKHWSPNAEVTVLGYNFPTFDLPDNFKFISLGKQEEYGREWTTALIPYFTHMQLPDEYFIYLADDYYILDVNEFLMYEAEKHMIDGIEKVHLTNFSNRVFNEEKDVNFNIWDQDAKYRLALQPTFIRRDYFLKYLNTGKTIWQYERNFNDPRNDGAQILVAKQNIVSYSNFSTHRGIAPIQMSKIRKEDLDILKQLGVF